MIRRSIACVLAALIVGGCATTQFERYISDQQWVAAAHAFDADSSLRKDERALYRAGVLFGSPGRPTYDPVKARSLLLLFLQRFPGSDKRDNASDRLSLLDDVVRTRAESATRQRDLEARIDGITAEVRQLHERLDSASSQGDQMRRNVARLESDLHEREDQVRALRLELQRLKEIDLKPRRPPEAFQD